MSEERETEIENKQLMIQLFNKIGGNVGHDFTTIIKELIHNSIDSVDSVEDLHIQINYSSGKLEISDNNRGSRRQDSFLHSATQKINQLGRKNSGLKDAFMHITQGYGNLTIYSNCGDKEHYIGLDMNNCCLKHRYETDNYGDKKGELDYNSFVEEFNDNYLRFTYDKSLTNKKNAHHKESIDKAIENIINNEFKKNITQKSGTIIGININETQKELIDQFNIEINKPNFFEKVIKGFNRPFKLSIIDGNNKVKSFKIEQDNGIYSYLGTKNIKRYVINNECELIVSCVSDEKAAEQKNLYDMQIDELRVGAVSFCEDVLSFKSKILCGQLGGSQIGWRRSIANLRAILKIKTNSSIISKITQVNKSCINLTGLPDQVKNKLKVIRNELKKYGFNKAENIKKHASESYKNSDINQIIIDMKATFLKKETKEEMDVPVAMVEDVKVEKPSKKATLPKKETKKEIKEKMEVPDVIQPMTEDVKVEKPIKKATLPKKTLSKNLEHTEDVVPTKEVVSPDEVVDFEILYKKLKEEMETIYEEMEKIYEEMEEERKENKKEIERRDDIINYITEKYPDESNINVCKHCGNWFLFNDSDKTVEGDEYWICDKCV